MRLLKKSNNVIFTLLFILMTTGIMAQVYVEGGKTRHRFAQMNLTADIKYWPSSGRASYLNQTSGDIISESMSESTEFRLHFAGTHFWGHAEFYAGIPIYNSSENFKTTGETGFKIFPWRLEHKRLVPFIGASWLTFQYKQEGGPSLFKSSFPLVMGLAYSHNNHVLEIQGGWLSNRKHNYYLSRNVISDIEVPRQWIAIGYKFILDATISAEPSWKDGSVQKLSDKLGKRLNGFTFGIGPSSATFLKGSSYIDSEVPFIHNYKFADLYPDIGLGYYFHKPDIHVGLAYRNIKKTLESYGYKQKVDRKSIGLEAFRFLFDYHGFVPYMGPLISYESLRMSEYENDILIAEYSDKKIKPGITFGWDIRPNRLQMFYLRTNLRWVPNLNLDVKDGLEINFDQLEFNFIQLVIFPGRIF